MSENIKVGDRIKVNRNPPTKSSGTTGTVIKIENDALYWCADDKYTDNTWGKLADAEWLESEGLSSEYLGKRIGYNMLSHFGIIHKEQNMSTNFRVGQKVKIDPNSEGLSADSLLELENKSGIYEIAGLDDGRERAMVCFGPIKKGGASFGYDATGCGSTIQDEKYLVKNNRFWWVKFENLESASNMIENLKDSGKKLGGAIKHGAAVGTATEIADFAYNMACNLLHDQLGIPLGRLRAPAVREIITAAGVALLHISAGAANEYLPGMSRVQSGCELVFEGKSKDHMSALLRSVGPMLMHVAELTDPEKAMERLGETIKRGFEEKSGDVRFQTVELDADTKIEPKPEPEVESELEPEVETEVVQAVQAVQAAQAAQAIV